MKEASNHNFRVKFRQRQSKLHGDLIGHYLTQVTFTGDKDYNRLLTIAICRESQHTQHTNTHAYTHPHHAHPYEYVTNRGSGTLTSTCASINTDKFMASTENTHSHPHLYMIAGIPTHPTTPRLAFADRH